MEKVASDRRVCWGDGGNAGAAHRAAEGVKASAGERRRSLSEPATQAWIRKCGMLAVASTSRVP